MAEALTHNPEASPALIPKIRKSSDPVKRRGRAFGLGQRNPKTLPYVHNDSETREENDRRTAHWRKVGKLVRAGRFVGSKY